MAEKKATIPLLKLLGYEYLGWWEFFVLAKAMIKVGVRLKALFTLE